MPDDLVVQLVEEELDQVPPSFIIHGWPNSAKQAELFTNKKDNLLFDMVIVCIPNTNDAQFLESLTPIMSHFTAVGIPVRTIQTDLNETAEEVTHELDSIQKKYHTPDPKMSRRRKGGPSQLKLAVTSGFMFAAIAAGFVVAARFMKK